MCGIPASGKTTLSRTFTDSKLYECDEFFKFNRSYNQSDLFYKKISNDLKNGLDVIVDGTFILKTYRLRLLDRLKSADCKKVILVMNTPLEECLKRNKNREKQIPEWMIHDMYNNFEYPTLDEGWDEIIMEGVKNHERNA